ncbi:hypothetical protein GGS21DRAFT_304639 [Xylaria nigripes]|nr:hypothetical protein GGS21DRAFT_304639 [Xylaria nigripes]
MKAAATSSVIVKIWLSLSIASCISLASARDASTAPEDLTDYYPRWKMSLVINPTELAPGGSQYDVVPMTLQAGFQQTDTSKLPDISGDLVLLDHSNYTKIDYADKVIYLCCDSSTTDSNMITPSLILNTIINSTNVPTAILLYSNTKPFCYVGGGNFAFNRIWSMASTSDTRTVHAIIIGTPEVPVVASIMPSARAIDNHQPGPGSSSAVAMSVLYSITGLITLLFLFIITTGALRAHRNPERYGPRASTNGRPRRSRARGLAMAMLETLPIVKFGEPDERKPDEETALESVSGVVTQQANASHEVTTDGASNNAVVSESPTESPTEAANTTNAQHTPKSTPAPTNPPPQESSNERQSGDDHLGCSICTEDFTVGEDVRVLPCNHKFHPACVDPWLVNVSGTCPLCRLDLRPPEDIEREETGGAVPSPEAATTTANNHSTPSTGAEQAPESTGNPEVTHRSRRSRLLDWNRLRHASVDERLQALRLYRQTQQGSDQTGAADDDRRHSRLADRLRRLHIRSDMRSRTATPETPPPPSSTEQH